jgi:hypothetical protein
MDPNAVRIFIDDSPSGAVFADGAFYGLPPQRLGVVAAVSLPGVALA